MRADEPDEAGSTPIPGSVSSAEPPVTRRTGLQRTPSALVVITMSLAGQPGLNRQSFQTR